MRKNAKVIGIIGGTGAGKTTVSKFLIKEFGGFYISGDELGHLLLLDPYIVGQVKSRYGENVIEDNKISRVELGKIVFSKSEELLWLNDLMHPILYDMIENLIKTNKKITPLIIVDGAALIEAKITELCDELVFVWADEEVRLNRLIEGRNINFSRARAIMDAQKDDSYFKEYSDMTIDLSKDINDSRDNIKEMIAEIL